MRTTDRRSPGLAVSLIATACAAALTGLAVALVLPGRAEAAPAGLVLTPAEADAVRVLRLVAAAQEALRTTAAIDTDNSGRGEFGFLAELAGTAPLRIYDQVTAGPALGVAGDELKPPLLPHAFGQVQPDASGDGVVELGGYLFRVYLPGPTAAGITSGVGELGTGGSDGAALPDPDNVEHLWCLHAWPAAHGPAAARAFFVNQEGVPLTTRNRDGGYDGLAQVPAFDAAYSDETGGNDMRAPLGITALLEPLGFAANDGRVWEVVEP